jgi:hypothetical protein
MAQHTCARSTYLGTRPLPRIGQPKEHSACLCQSAFRVPPLLKQPFLVDKPVLIIVLHLQLANLLLPCITPHIQGAIRIQLVQRTQKTLIWTMTLSRCFLK